MIINSLQKCTFFFLLLIAFSKIVSAQRTPDSLLLDFSVKYPQEKVYLQFDRSYYNPGETIWFKAYLVTNLQPSSLSKTLYADLTDEKGNILQRKIMPVTMASAASGFELPDSIHLSTIYVRAYTAWMLNFDSSLIYVKPLHIITSSGSHNKAAALSYSVNFFPEGGDLVMNIPSRVAFKATDQYGSPADIKGTIVDEDNHLITSFSSMHDGMGVFNLTPLPGKTYKAIWKNKMNASQETALPAVKETGATLMLNNSDSSTAYTICRSDQADEDDKSFYVIAQIEGQLLYSAKVNMEQAKKVTAAIPTTDFPDGVMQVTILNKAMMPVAERIVFINHGNYYFNTDLHAVEKNLAKRKRNVLQIDVGGTLVSNLSVAVTDADLNASGGNEESIFSSLLLSSNLKGNIYDPAYYFLNDDDSVKQQLDLVMMTNGWRRFKWVDLVKNNLPILKYQPENQYIIVKGKVFGLTKNQLYNKELTAIMQVKNAGIKTYTIPVNRDGEFNLPDLYFFDTAKIYYQINNDKDKLLTGIASFSFHNDFITPPAIASSASFLPFTTDSLTLKKNILAAKTAQQIYVQSKNIKSLEEVKVTTHVKTQEEKMDDEYTSGLFSSGDAHTFIIQDDPSIAGFPGIINYLQGKVAGLTIYTDGSNQASVTWRGSGTSFFLNEMQTDVSNIQQIPMNDIAMIKVFPPPFIGGTGGGSPGGAIAVYTKKGGSTNPAFKGLDHVSIQGYSVTKEFYSPNYEIKNDTTLNDARTTLYWNPFVIMDAKQRRVTLPFYNSDKCRRIKVIIEGINENGQLTREEKLFQ